MAFVCDYCEKKSDYGHNVSHAKNRTRRIRRPNLHSARVLEAGKVVRRRLCSRCLRAAERPKVVKIASEDKKSDKKSE